MLSLGSSGVIEEPSEFSTSGPTGAKTLVEAVIEPAEGASCTAAPVSSCRASFSTTAQPLMKGRFSLAHLLESVSSEESGMFTNVAYADERERGLSKGVSLGEFVSVPSDAGLWPCASNGAFSTRAADVVPYTLPADEVPAIIPAAVEAVRREATSALHTAEAFKLETVSIAVLSAALSVAALESASAEAPAGAACTPAPTLAEAAAAEPNAEPSVRDEAEYVTVLAFDEVFCF